MGEVWLFKFTEVDGKNRKRLRMYPRKGYGNLSAELLFHDAETLINYRHYIFMRDIACAISLTYHTAAHAGGKETRGVPDRCRDIDLQ